MIIKRIAIALSFVGLAFVSMLAFDGAELEATTYAPTDVAYEDTDGTLWTYEDIFAGSEVPLSDFTAMGQENIIDNGDGTYTVENTVAGDGSAQIAFGIEYSGSENRGDNYYLSFKPVSINYVNYSTNMDKLRLNAYQIVTADKFVWLQTRNVVSLGDSFSDPSYPVSISSDNLTDLAVGDSFTLHDSVLLVNKSQFATAPTDEQIRTWSYHYLNPTVDYNEPVDNPQTADDIAHIDYESNTSYSYNDIFAGSSFDPLNFEALDSVYSTITYNAGDFTVSVADGKTPAFFGVTYPITSGLDRYYFSYKMNSIDYNYANAQEAYRTFNYSGTTNYKSDDTTNRQFIKSPFDEYNLNYYERFSYSSPSIDIISPNDSFSDIDSFTIDNDMTYFSLSQTFANSVEGDYPTTTELYDMETTYRTLTDTYEVTFEDYDGSILKTEYVQEGADATPPTDPTHPDYNFTGWDGSYTNITANTNIKATYGGPNMTLTYYDWDGTVAKTETVQFGYDGVPPTIGDPPYQGFAFDTWEDTYKNVETDTSVYAKYTVDRTGHTISDVAYLDHDGSAYTYTDIFNDTKIDISEFNGISGDIVALQTDGSYKVSPGTAGQRFFGLEYTKVNTSVGDYFTSFNIIEKNFIPQSTTDFTLNVFDSPGLDFSVTPDVRYSTIFNSADNSDFLYLRTTFNSENYETTENFVIENSFYNVYIGDFQSTPTTTEMDSMLEVYTAAVSTVTFLDYDGTVLKTETVEIGTDATPPADPSRPYYTFTGWDGNYTNVQQDEVVTATYKSLYYTVIFEDYDGVVLKQEEVFYATDATPPADPSRPSHTFTGWDGNYTNVQQDEVVTATYQINTYDVTFEDYDGTVLKTETVEHGSDATPPDIPDHPEYTFDSWDGTYTNVQQDETVVATYDTQFYTVTFMNANGDVLKRHVVEYGGNVTPPIPPTYELYTFDSWDGEYTNITSDRIITATYEDVGGLKSNVQLFLFNSRMGDSFSQIMLIIAIIIVLTIVLQIAGAPYVVTILVNTLLFIIGIVFGIIPMWILLLMFMIVFGYILLVMFDISPGPSGGERK